MNLMERLSPQVRTLIRFMNNTCMDEDCSIPLGIPPVCPACNTKGSLRLMKCRDRKRFVVTLNGTFYCSLASHFNSTRGGSGAVVMARSSEWSM